MFLLRLKYFKPAIGALLTGGILFKLLTPKEVIIPLPPPPKPFLKPHWDDVNNMQINTNPNIKDQQYWDEYFKNTFYHEDVHGIAPIYLYRKELSIALTNFINSVPQEYRSHEMYKRMVQLNSGILSQVPISHRKTQDMADLIFKTHRKLYLIEDEYITKEMIEDLLKETRTSRYFGKEFWNYSMNIPPRLFTMDICEKILDHKPSNFVFFPEGAITKEFCNICVPKYNLNDQNAYEARRRLNICRNM